MYTRMAGETIVSYNSICGMLLKERAFEDEISLLTDQISHAKVPLLQMEIKMTRAGKKYWEMGNLICLYMCVLVVFWEENEKSN